MHKGKKTRGGDAHRPRPRPRPRLYDDAPTHFPPITMDDLLTGLTRSKTWGEDAPRAIAPRPRLYDDDPQPQAPPPDVSHTMGRKSWGGDAPPAVAPRPRLYDDDAHAQPAPAMGDLLGVPRDEKSHGYRATLPRVRWVSFSFAADQRLLGSAWYGVWIHNWKAILIVSAKMHVSLLSHFAPFARLPPHGEPDLGIVCCPRHTTKRLTPPAQGSGVPYKRACENITRFLLRRQDDCALAIQVRSSIDAGILNSNRILTYATTASEIFNKLPGFKLPEYHDRQPGMGVVRYSSYDLILCVDWAEGLTPRETDGWSRFGTEVRGRFHTGPEMTLFEGS